MLCPSQNVLQGRTRSIAELNSVIGIAKDQNRDLLILELRCISTLYENGCITPFPQYCPTMVLLFE